MPFNPNRRAVVPELLARQIARLATESALAAGVPPIPEDAAPLTRLEQSTVRKANAKAQRNARRKATGQKTAAKRRAHRRP